MRWPSNTQLKNWFMQMRHILDELEPAAIETVRRGKIGSRDGYPTSSSRPSSGGRSGDHADPVFQIAVSDPLSDPVRESAITLVQSLENALDRLLAASQAYRRSLPPIEHELSAVIGIPKCANQHCDDLATGGAGRCEPCRKYRKTHGYDPGKHIIVDRIDRRRST